MILLLNNDEISDDFVLGSPVVQKPLLPKPATPIVALIGAAITQSKSDAETAGYFESSNAPSGHRH